MDIKPRELYLLFRPFKVSGPQPPLRQSHGLGGAGVDREAANLGLAHAGSMLSSSLELLEACSLSANATPRPQRPGCLFYLQRRMWEAGSLALQCESAEHQGARHEVTVAVSWTA